MKLVLATVIAGLAASSLPAQEVSVAGGDWSDIPPLVQLGSKTISERALTQLTDAVALNKCEAAGSEKHMKLSVPFLLRFSGQGNIEQVVVQRIGCPAVETVLGGAVLQLAKSGEYRPSGVNQTGWYRGLFEVSYN